MEKDCAFPPDGERPEQAVRPFASVLPQRPGVDEHKAGRER